MANTPKAVFIGWQAGVNYQIPLFNVDDPDNVTRRHRSTVSLATLEALGIAPGSYPKYEEWVMRGRRV